MRSLALALLLAAPAAARAASAGAEPFQFLLLDADARAVALGGAYTALARDGNAALYNPAWLGAVRRHHAVFMHNAHLGDAAQEYLGLATRWGVGALVNTVDYGELPRTTVSNPGGVGTYGARDLAASAGYGRSWGPAHAGFAFKVVRETLDTVTSNAWAADVGLGWRRDDGSEAGLGDLGPSLGLSLQNMGPRARFLSASENLPLTARVGAAYGFELGGQRALLSLEAAKTRADEAVAAFGAETVVLKTLALRVGYSGRNQAGPGVTGGVGLRLWDLSVDYAVTPFGELGLAHRASVGLRFGPEGYVAGTADEPARRRPELQFWPSLPEEPKRKKPSRKH